MWQRDPGSQNYSFRELQYRYDGSGTFLGSLVLTANVVLTGANSRSMKLFRFCLVAASEGFVGPQNK